MIRTRTSFAASLPVLLLGLAANSALGEVPAVDTVIGTWSLVSVDNVFPDGHRVQLYGARPQGRLMFDVQGRYALQIMRGEPMRFAANDRLRGTPEENKAAVERSNTHFGRYETGKDGTLVFSIDHASFPNWEGTQQKRAFKLAADVLVYTVPVPTTGGAAIGEVTWQRAKP